MAPPVSSTILGVGDTRGTGVPVCRMKETTSSSVCHDRVDCVGEGA